MELFAVILFFYFYKNPIIKLSKLQVMPHLNLIFIYSNSIRSAF